MLILDSWIYYPCYKYVLDYNLIIPLSVPLFPYGTREDEFKEKCFRIEFDYSKYPKIKVLGAIGNIIVELFCILIGSIAYTVLAKLFNPSTKKFDVLVNVKALGQMVSNQVDTDFLSISVCSNQTAMSSNRQISLNVPFIDKLMVICMTPDRYLISDNKINSQLEDLLLEYIITNFKKDSDGPFFVNPNLNSDTDIVAHCDSIVDYFLSQDNGMLYSYIRDSNPEVMWKSDFELILENIFTSLSTEVKESLFNKNIMVNKTIPATVPVSTLVEFSTSGFLDKRPLGYYFDSNIVTLQINDPSMFSLLTDFAINLPKHPVTDLVILSDVLGYQKQQMQYCNRNGILQLSDNEYKHMAHEIANSTYVTVSYRRQLPANKTKNNNILVWKNAMEEVFISDNIQLDIAALLLTFWY